MDAKLASCVVLLCIFSQVELKSVDKPVELNESNWRDILEGQWVVSLVAPWCPACRAFKPTFEALAKWSKDLDFRLGIIDVTQNAGLSGRFLVTSLPTIYHVINGEFRRYNGNRQEADLISFIDDKKWKELEPVSFWTHPNSFHMSVVDWFFKSAMMVREFYNMLTDYYGIPEWACYVIIAVLTIAIGLFCGLLIVCCCDLCFPPRYHAPGQIRPDLSKSEEEFLNRDTPDIVDDTLPEDERDPGDGVEGHGSDGGGSQDEDAVATEEDEDEVDAEEEDKEEEQAAGDREDAKDQERTTARKRRPIKAD